MSQSRPTPTLAMIFRRDLKKNPPEALWKRALRNRKYWDNYQLAHNAFELSRQLAFEETQRAVEQAKRVAALRMREERKQKQIAKERSTKQKIEVASQPTRPAAPCHRCGQPMVYKPGIVAAVHVGKSCPKTASALSRITVEFCVEMVPWRNRLVRCPRPSVTPEKLCARCANNQRRELTSSSDGKLFGAMPNTAEPEAPSTNPDLGFYGCPECAGVDPRCLLCGGQGLISRETMRDWKTEQEKNK